MKVNNNNQPQIQNFRPIVKFLKIYRKRFYSFVKMPGIRPFQMKQNKQMKNYNNKDRLPNSKK